MKLFIRLGTSAWSVDVFWLLEQTTYKVSANPLNKCCIADMYDLSDAMGFLNKQSCVHCIMALMSLALALVPITHVCFRESYSSAPAALWACWPAFHYPGREDSIQTVYLQRKAVFERLHSKLEIGICDATDVESFVDRNGASLETRSSPCLHGSPNRGCIFHCTNHNHSNRFAAHIKSSSFLSISAQWFQSL